MTAQIHDDWRLINPPPGLYGFTYNLSLDNGHLVRWYLGSSTFRTNWETYSGSGKLVRIWHDIYGTKGTQKFITGMHKTAREAQLAECLHQIRHNIPHNPNYLNIVQGAGTNTKFLHRHETHELILKQMATWEPLGRKPAVIVVAKNGIFGFNSTRRAAKAFTMNQSTLSNLASQRRRQSQRSDIVCVRFIARKLVDYIPDLTWIDDD